MKKILLTIALTSLSFSSSNIGFTPYQPSDGETQVKEERTSGALQSPKKVNSYFEYDAPGGWWWYKETYEKDGKKFDTKIKMSKQDKVKFDKEAKTQDLLKQQIIILSDIKDRQEYAHPYVAPIYSKHEKTGKKCLTNSDEHCFVLPVQAEAQRVPVMASWLRDPSPTNSKKWLRWEAKYFNQLQKISLGNRFAYLSGGGEAFPTNTIYTHGDSVRGPLSEKSREARKRDMIAEVGKKLDVIVLMGITSALDQVTQSHKEIYSWNQPEFKKYNYHFVFHNENSLDLFERMIKNETVPSNRAVWKRMKEENRVFVSKKYFNKFNVKISPSVVALYKTDKKVKDEKGKDTDKNEIIWQTIYTGDINPTNIKGAIFRFLEYNGILKAKDLANETNFGTLQKNVDYVKPEVNEKEIYKDSQRIK